MDQEGKQGTILWWEPRHFHRPDDNAEVNCVQSCGSGHLPPVSSPQLDTLHSARGIFSAEAAALLFQPETMHQAAAKIEWQTKGKTIKLMERVGLDDL